MAPGGLFFLALFFSYVSYYDLLFHALSFFSFILWIYNRIGCFYWWLLSYFPLFSLLGCGLAGHSFLMLLCLSFLVFVYMYTWYLCTALNCFLSLPVVTHLVYHLHFCTTQIHYHVGQQNLLEVGDIMTRTSEILFADKGRWLHKGVDVDKGIMAFNGHIHIRSLS